MRAEEDLSRGGEPFPPQTGGMMLPPFPQPHIEPLIDLVSASVTLVHQSDWVGPCCSFEGGGHGGRASARCGSC
jgi:hypothetical protein